MYFPLALSIFPVLCTISAFAAPAPFISIDNVTSLAGTNTTQPPSSGIIEIRQDGDDLDVFAEIFDFAKAIVDLTVESVSGDLEAQQESFTTNTITQLMQAYPTKNAIVYHDQGSEYNFVGASHVHFEMDVPLGTKGYEIWVFDSGSFQLVGDGGFVNWAYGGCYQTSDNVNVQFCTR